MKDDAIYDSVSTLRPYAIWQGAKARAIKGERLTVAIVELEADLDVPEHHHQNEQVGFVLRGQITMVIGGSAKLLSKGDTYVIWSDVPHSARTESQGATVVDVFAPTREDWEQMPRLDPGPAGWPD